MILPNAVLHSICSINVPDFGYGLQVLESAVEHFFNFGEFYSTFEVARAEFVGGGRTFFSILDDFVLLSRPRALDFDQAVDKNHTFSPFFVYFRGRASRIWTNR